MSTFQIDEEYSFKSISDLVDRPDYSASVEPKKYVYEKIKAVYAFKEDSVSCSVNDCLSEHHKGYLIAMSNKKECNMCESCGKKFFHADYEKQKKTFQNQTKIRTQKVRLNEILNNDVIINRVNELKRKPHGANWLYQVLKSFYMAYPTELILALKKLSINKDDESIFENLIDNKTEPFQIENIERLQGLKIFTSDIREELIGKILTPLIELNKIADKSDVKISLIKYCKWADGLEEQFDKAEELIQEGQDFFESNNLERLKSLPLPDHKERLVRSSSWNIKKAEKAIRV